MLRKTLRKTLRKSQSRLRKTMTYTDIVDIMFRGKPMSPCSKALTVTAILPVMAFLTVITAMYIHMLIRDGMNKFLISLIIFALVIVDIAYVAVWVYFVFHCDDASEKRTKKEYGIALKEWEQKRSEQHVNGSNLDEMQRRIDILETQLRNPAPSAPASGRYFPVVPDVVPKSSR
jgi:hypothetical protein